MAQQIVLGSQGKVGQKISLEIGFAPRHPATDQVGQKIGVASQNLLIDQLAPKPSTGGETYFQTDFMTYVLSRAEQAYCNFSATLLIPLSSQF
jgi:hypothetical protein